MHWSSVGFTAWSLLSLTFNTKLIRTWSEQSHSHDQRHRVPRLCSALRRENVTLHARTHTRDWQQRSIRSLPRARTRRAFTESYQSSTWWHASLPALSLSSLFFIHSSSSMFSSLTFPPHYQHEKEHAMCLLDKYSLTLSSFAKRVTAICVEVSFEIWIEQLTGANSSILASNVQLLMCTVACTEHELF